MVSALDPTLDTEIGGCPEFQTVVPTAETNQHGLFDGLEDSSSTTSASEQQSQQSSLGEVVGGAIVLIGAAWLAGEILGEIFGSSADLTAVEQQILASA
ncbi:hypothetical protein [Haloarcula sp. CBA1127]|uniref:hypothetical protein n=1 Tax=Haloarcula sp. CBA1127 TaxID=1765055 RepID=UPI00073F6421|nr:hypothetical protein [Haloarcula sp. CBA1127]